MLAASLTQKNGLAQGVRAFEMVVNEIFHSIQGEGTAGGNAERIYSSGGLSRRLRLVRYEIRLGRK